MRSLSLLALAAAASTCWATSCDFEGGLSIRRPEDCGIDTVKCKAGASQRCCPQSFSCHYTNPDRGGNAYCCRGENDCLNDIKNYPQCAYGNRTLWVVEGGDVTQSFCCDVGWQGVIRGDGVGAACSQGSSIGKKETRASRYDNSEATCVDTSTTTADATSTTADATSADATTTGSAEATGTSSADSSINTDTSDDSSVGGGAIAGIVIGSVAGVGLIAAAAFWIFRRRSQSHKEEQKAAYSTVELGGNDNEGYASRYAGGGYPPTELDTPHTQPQELAGKEIRREGDTSGPRPT